MLVWVLVLLGGGWLCVFSFIILWLMLFLLWFMCIFWMLCVCSYVVSLVGLLISGSSVLVVVLLLLFIVVCSNWCMVNGIDLFWKCLVIGLMFWCRLVWVIVML